MMEDPVEGTKRVAITFDDGTRDFYHHALPVIRDLEVPVTLFVVAGAIGEPTGASAETVIGPPEERRSDGPDSTRSERIKRSEFLTAEQLSEIATEELVTIGNHTRTHPDLTALTSTNRLRDEIAGAQETLAAMCGHPIDRFSFPYGRMTQTALEIVKDTHCMSVTSQHHLLNKRSRHAIPRFRGHVPEWQLRADISDLRWRVSGFVSPILTGSRL